MKSKTTFASQRSHTRKGLINCPLAAARIIPPRRVFISELRQDAKALHLICKWTAAAIEDRGWTEARALRVFSRRHQGKLLHNGARLRLSERTLRRCLRAWRPVRSAAAFPKRYVSARKVSPTLRRVMLAAVMRPEVVSIGQAARIALCLVKGSARACYRALHPAEAAALKQLYMARIAALKAEKLARAALRSGAGR